MTHYQLRQIGAKKNSFKVLDILIKSSLRPSFNSALTALRNSLNEFGEQDSKDGNKLSIYLNEETYQTLLDLGIKLDKNEQYLLEFR